MKVTMSTMHNEPSHQDAAVEFLARKSHVSIDDVVMLYGIELAKLEPGARITGYLPIFAIRNVSEILRHHHSGNLAIA
jgi:hypothetical protein